MCLMLQRIPHQDYKTTRYFRPAFFTSLLQDLDGQIQPIEVIWKKPCSLGTHPVFFMVQSCFFVRGLFAEVTYLSNLVLSFGVLNILFAIMVPPSWVANSGVEAVGANKGHNVGHPS